MSDLLDSYHIGVIDIGSPKLGNLGWCILDNDEDKEYTGSNLDDLFPLVGSMLKRKGMLLGLEAPLFVPIRENLLWATKARKGEGRRPWSAGAGAQVLAINLPVMVYIFKGIQSACQEVEFCLNESSFRAKEKQIMLFEALVSGKDKGSSHIHDAQIMAQSCNKIAKKNMLPVSLLEHEDHTDFFNLAAAALLYCGLTSDVATLHSETPIYAPTSIYAPTRPV